MELPQYTLRPATDRMVAPWIVKLILLSIVFYVGIYFNVDILFNMKIPMLVNVLIIIFLLVLIIAQLFIYHLRFGKYRYLFFTNRIEYDAKKTKVFMFDDFSQAELGKDLLDKLFNTGFIRLSKDFEIGPISNPLPVKDYLEKLVRYHQAARHSVRLGQQQAAMQQSQQSQSTVQNTQLAGVQQQVRSFQGSSSGGGS